MLGPLDTGAALSPRERTILSALIVRRPDAIPPGELADACWGADAPPTWAQQVKKSISTIRRMLGADSVRTLGADYAFGLDPDTLDATRFERLVSAARQQQLHGEHDRAIDAYQRALALWRGRPFPDIADWEPGVVETMRLTEIRDSAAEELLDARLNAGDERAVIPDAERLVRENPLREDRWAILALANYRAGRQAEALATVRAARERLLDELGIEPGARLRDLEVAMLRQDPGLVRTVATPSASSQCPYPGLAAFGLDDAEVFFGRETDVEALVDRLRPGALVAVVGPSGSGKSSLVLAGVLPRLVAGGRVARIVRPGTGGAASFADAVERGGVVVVDQAEELMQVTGAEIEDFCARAAEFLTDGGTIVLTLRSDFLDRATALPHVGEAVARGVYALAPLSAASLREAIEQPARHAHLRWEPGLVELVLRDAADRSTTLPHVSHALRETWARRAGAVLTVEGYEATGGIAGAIAQSAETLYRQLSPSERTLCRALMLRLVARDAEGLSLRRRTPLPALLADADRRGVIEKLVAARLVVVDGEAIMIAHEAIATAWPRLDGWLEEDAAGARLMGSLELAAQTWDADGRPADALLRGGRLQALREWREDAQPDLTEAEAALLDASTTAERDELSALQEHTRQQRRQNRRLRWALGGIGVVLVAAVAAGGLAAASARNATVEAVTSRALSLRTTDRELAALMAVAAHESWPGDERTSTALVGSVTEAAGYIGTTYVPDAQWRVGVWPIPGTTQAAIVRDQVNVEIIDYVTGERIRSLTPALERPPGIIRPWVRVSADGSTMAIAQHFADPQTGAGEVEHVSFFDLESGRQVGSTIVTTTATDTISLSPDGAHLTWAATGTLVVVDRDTGEVRTAEVETTPPEAMSWSAASAYGSDGSLRVATVTGRLLEIDPETLAVRGSVAIPPRRMNNAILIADDGTVFGIGIEGVAVIDSAGVQVWTRGFERTWECSRPLVSSTTEIAGCGDERGSVQLWNLRTGMRIAEPFDYQGGGSGDLALVDGDRELLLLSAILPRIGRLRVDGSGAGAEIVARGQTTAAGFSPDGTRIIVRGEVVEGAETPLSVWDVESDEAVFRIPDDVVDDYDGYLASDPRWLTDDLLGIWRIDTDDDGTETPHMTVLDISTGRFVATELPDDTWDVYPSPDRDRFYVTQAVPDENSFPQFEPWVSVFDPSTLTLLPQRFNAADYLYSVASSTDGSQVFVTRWINDSLGFRTSVYDGATGEATGEGLERMFSVAWAGGDTVIGAGDTGLYEYSSRTLERIGTLPAQKSRVSKVSLTGDLQTLMSASTGDDGVSLIDLATRRRLGDAMFAGDDGIADVARDGSAFVISVPQGVALWSLDPDAQSDALCRMAGREPTADEWANYFSELGAQHPLCADVLG
ncbi:hypothetical protein GCM10025738_05810 [Microbacterium fluvii]